MIVSGFSGSAGLCSGSLPDQVHRWNGPADLSRVQLGLRARLGGHHLHAGWRNPLLPADGHIRGCNVLNFLSALSALLEILKRRIQTLCVRFPCCVILAVIFR